MNYILRSIRRKLMNDIFGRRFTIELEPGDIITFRQYRKRKTYSVSLYHVYVLAVYHTMLEDYKQNMEIYQRKKKAGYKRLKRPAKPNLAMVSRHIREIHDMGSSLHAKSKGA